MYKHILVPIVFDHGSQGWAAVETASHLLAEDGTITLLHVLEDVPVYAAAHIPHGVREKHRETAMSELHKLADKVSANTLCSVIHGHSSQSILDYAEKHSADCIVISSHKPGLEDYFIGSTAARVVRHARSAVHVMR